MIDITIGNKTYKVEEAKTQDDHVKGLMNRNSLPDNEGMLFYFEEPQTASFWMKNTKIPLDIIFINEDLEVTKVVEGIPMSEDMIEQEDTLYVLEVNAGSRINVGDELELPDDEEDKEPTTMKVLAPDGSIQMELEGGERIFSRANTKTLIKLAKKAYKSKEDKDYAKLGNKIFKYLKIQDTNEPEYVKSPEN